MGWIRLEEVRVADAKTGPELHLATVELARGANYGSITTVLPSGDLQTQMIWVHTDGERLVVKPTFTARSSRTSSETPG
jgi:hypothetical protein